MSFNMDSHDLALVIDNAACGLAEAEATLERIRGNVQPDMLRGMDLLYLEPDIIIALFYFDASGFDVDTLNVFSGEARKDYCRLLDLSHLKPEEHRSFIAQRSAQAAISSKGVLEPSDFFAQVQERWRNSQPLLQSDKAVEIISALYPSEEVFLSSFRERPVKRLFAVRRAGGPLPEPGSEVVLAVALESGQGPMSLSARVRAQYPDAAISPWKQIGFEVELPMPAEEANLFESFLIAVRRRTTWPDRSGRCFERFPFRLRVEYDYQGEARRDYTLNISRGGLFLDTFDPPAGGATLQMTVYAPGHEQGHLFNGEVTHAVDAEMAVEQNVKAGAGVRFIEDASAIRDRLDALLVPGAEGGRKRALLVDDDAFFRRLFSSALQLAGFRVYEASRGDEAFTMLMEELLMLDVLITDHYMPGMTGVELVDKVRRVGGEMDLAILMVTSAEFSEQERGFIAKLGCDDILSKQLAADEMIERIEDVISRRWGKEEE